MPAPVAIVSAADAAYSGLLRGLVASVRACAPRDGVALCVLDVGLEPAQRAWAEACVERVVDARWDVALAEGSGAPRRLQALTARPFLPRYFPGHDAYVWIDADAWVQQWSAVTLLLDAARRGRMGVVPEIDRAYRCHYDLGTAQRWMHRCYRLAFGGEVAGWLWRMPVVNAGVFSLAAESPAWEAWARRLRAGAGRTTEFVDQTALNVAVHTDEIEADFLPATCNWQCVHALPAVDAASGALVEPHLPNAALGIVHLSGPRAKAGPVTLETTAGARVVRWVTHDGQAPALPVPAARA